MKKLLITASIVVLSFSLSASSRAASTLAVAGSGGANQAVVGATTTSHGAGFAAAGAAGISAGTSAGIAVATPAGSLSAGVGQTNNFAGAGGLTAGVGGGGGSFVAGSAVRGVNVGGGFTNTTP